MEDRRRRLNQRLSLIEAWYNRRRRNSSLGMLSPLEYESQHHDGHAVTNP
jgi:hypothetical protein